MKTRCSIQSARRALCAPMGPATVGSLRPRPRHSLALTPSVVLYGARTEQPLPHFTRPTISLHSDRLTEAFLVDEEILHNECEEIEVDESRSARGLRLVTRIQRHR